MPENRGSMLSVVEIPTCCGTSAPPAGETRFHFSLNVSNLERSIAFYRVLFDAPPAKHHPDYAKFELSEPPLVFSLVPSSPSTGGSLSHFGFPVGSTEEVQAAAKRLAEAGLETCCQDGTVCGYARQDKVWIADPDRNYWEIYVVHEDVDPESVRTAFDGVAPLVALPAETPEPARLIWEHRVLMPLPDRIPHDDATLDEVRLEGTFNDRCSREERARLLAEVRRVLRPRGKLSVHGLVADGPLNGKPELPGVAALVQQVPEESEPLAEVAAAGFEALRITKLPEKPVFRQGATGLREIKFEARPPEQAAGGPDRVVIYKGPFPVAMDDDGTTFHRGIRTPVNGQTWQRLASGAAASQFVFLDDAAGGTCGCG